MRPAKTNATYEDVLNAPEGMRAELIEGNLYLQAKPRGSHQLAMGSLFGQLDASAHGWVILPDVEIHIPMTLAPDLSGWRVERFCEDLDSAYFTVVPDWVCEILSPGTRSYDLGLKRSVYLQRGVSYLWLADPAERIVETFEAREGAWVLTGTFADDATVSAAPFPDVALKLARLWR